MKPDQTPQKPPHAPVNDRMPGFDRKTYQNTYTDRARDAYPLPGKPSDSRPKP